MENVSGRSTLASPTYKTMLDVKRITDIDPLLRKSDVTTKRLKGGYAMKGEINIIPESGQLNLKFALTHATKKGWQKGSRIGEMRSNPYMRLDFSFNWPFTVGKGRQVLAANTKGLRGACYVMSREAVERDNSCVVKSHG